MDRFEMQPPPKNKSFWMLPFVVHATRGVIRDQNTRRWTMFGTLLVALLSLFAGSTLLQSLLCAHPVWFVLFWFFVAWLMVTAILLGLFDLLIVRAEARHAKKSLRSSVSASKTEDAPPTPER
jgi:uncharacterized membrane protein YeiH